MAVSVILLSLILLTSIITNVYLWLYANFTCYCLERFDYNVLWYVAYAFIILTLIGVFYDLYKWEFGATLLLPLIVLTPASLTYTVFLLILMTEITSWNDVVIDNPIIRIDRIWTFADMVHYIDKRFAENPSLNKLNEKDLMIMTVYDFHIKSIAGVDKLFAELENAPRYQRSSYEPITMSILYYWPDTTRASGTSGIFRYRL